MTRPSLRRDVYATRLYLADVWRFLLARLRAHRTLYTTLIVIACMVAYGLIIGTVERLVP